jgi:hypothetical protein
MIQILARFFAEVDNISEAQKVACDIEILLQDCGKVNFHHVRPYWKIESYYEIEFSLLPTEDFTSLPSIAHKLDNKWICGGTSSDPWIVGNYQDGEFKIDSIRWASLEIVNNKPI